MTNAQPHFGFYDDSLKAHCTICHTRRFDGMFDQKSGRMVEMKSANPSTPYGTSITWEGIKSTHTPEWQWFCTKHAIIVEKALAADGKIYFPNSSQVMILLTG